jgi:hypothetical protein
MVTAYVVVSGRHYGGVGGLADALGDLACWGMTGGAVGWLLGAVVGIKVAIAKKNRRL